MIDILMATYNGEKYVHEQLESIFDQTYENWQLIIHDDCSADDTFSVIQKVVKEANCDDKVKYKVNAIPCGGAAANFMGLLQCAQSEYTMFCDQDDVWHSDKIEKTLNAMKHAEAKYGSKTPLLVYTDLNVVDKDLHRISDSFVEYMKIPKELKLSRLLLQNSVTGCTVMMNRSLYQLMQRAVKTDKIIMHDHLAALLAVIFGKAIFVKESTMDYRQHEKNSVGASNAGSFSYLWKRFCRGRAKFQQDMKNAMIQAQYVFEIYGDLISCDKKKNLISGFAQLQKQSKVKKICFYIKNKVVKYGWIRAIMQMVWS